MSDWTPHLYPFEREIEDAIPAIGLTALRWTQVEIATQRLLAAMVVAPRRIDVALAAHIPDRTALDVILSIARMRFKDHLLASIETFAKRHDTCRENRNLIVHGTHSRSEEGVEPKVMFIQRVSSRGNVKVVNYHVEPVTIYRVAWEIRALAGYGQTLINHVVALQSGSPPEELPQLFPPLDNLSKTLPTLGSHDVMRRREFASGWTTIDRGDEPPSET